MEKRAQRFLKITSGLASFMRAFLHASKTSGLQANMALETSEKMILSIGGHQ
jgi:hypothetical protein